MMGQLDMNPIPPFAVTEYDQRAFDRLFNKSIVLENGCIEFTGGQNPKGYGCFHYNGKTTGAHCAAYDLCVGDIIDDSHVLHTCDNRICINPEHLFLGSTQDNSEDMKNKNRQNKGEDRPLAKLTEADVINIRRLRNEGKSTIYIGAMYNISHSNVSMIARGLRWKHIKG